MPSSQPPAPSAAGLLEVRERIAAAARACARAPTDIDLVAVSKQQPLEAVVPVVEAGQRIFGENRVQEAIRRWAPLRASVAGLEIRLIGPLQSNKAREAVSFFEVIETLDRARLAAALADAVQKEGRSPRLFVQVNTGEEPQKAGVRPDEADAFISAARETFGLTVEGLMCIPPVDAPAFLHFALLRRIAARNGLERLSMGMSADFETAVRFGATSVRVGSAVFGARAGGATSSRGEDGVTVAPSDRADP